MKGRLLSLVQQKHFIFLCRFYVCHQGQFKVHVCVEATNVMVINGI